MSEQAEAEQSAQRPQPEGEPEGDPEGEAKNFDDEEPTRGDINDDESVPLDERLRTLKEEQPLVYRAVLAIVFLFGACCRP
jgi:hypothetical protein